MSEPIKTLRHFLAKSPSVIYPEDVLEYLPEIEAENARLIKKVNELDTQINLYVQTTLRAFGLVKENNEVLGSLAEDSIKLQKQGERLFDKTLELSTENAKLRELATYALKHIIEFECEEPDLKRFRGKPCEDCADCGSSDCPKCMPRMFDVSGIEVDE